MPARIAAPLLLLFALALQFVSFGPVLLQPGNYIFGTAEDAVKNYYTFAYYLANNGGSLHFSGLNYPYGEHILFTDNQPFFAYLLSLSPFAGRLNPLAFLNSLMLLSMPASALLLYGILRKNLLPVGYAMFTALCIAWLSPQLFRLDGHYALSYSWVIPLCWYLAIRIFEKPQQLAGYLVYGLALLVLGFIHPYYILIGAILFMAYALVFWLQDRKTQKLRRPEFLKIALTVILPLLLFNGWLKLTDPVTDRPGDPYGFVAYKASLNSVFFPVAGPLKDIWQQIFHTSDPVWEGIAYVGLAGFLVALLTVFKWGKLLRRKRYRLVFRPVLPVALRPALWASILTLLFAMAIPFRWNLEFLLDLLPPLKQFRSTGRFAWIFYYIFSVYLAFFAWQAYRFFRRRNKPLALGLLGGLLLLWGAEAFLNTATKAAAIRQHNQGESFTGQKHHYRELLQQAGYKASEFQAVLPLPYYAIGSEKMDVLPGWPTAAESMKLSYHTGLPLVSSMLSRTSLSQNYRHVQLFSAPVLEKEILEDLPTAKPLLIISLKTDTLRPREKEFLKKADLVYENDKLQLYKLPLSAFRSIRQQETAAFGQQKPALKTANGAYRSLPGEAYVYQGFTGGNPGISLFDDGAFFYKRSPGILYDNVLAQASDTTLYEASVWVYGLGPGALPKLEVLEKDQNGTVISEKTADAMQARDIFRNWVRVAVTFRLQNVRNRVTVQLTRKKITADCFMIRPVREKIYFIAPGNKLVMNNFPLFN